jgi:hypothetical protein
VAMALCGREREKTRWGLGERPPVAERMMRNETISPEDARRGGRMCKMQHAMQQHMQKLPEVVLPSGQLPVCHATRRSRSIAETENNGIGFSS